jgi:hypothetical protein
MPASATPCINGPNAAFDTKGKADTRSPSAIVTITGPRTVRNSAMLRHT